MALEPGGKGEGFIGQDQPVGQDGSDEEKADEVRGVDRHAGQLCLEWGEGGDECIKMRVGVVFVTCTTAMATCCGLMHSL